MDCWVIVHIPSSLTPSALRQIRLHNTYNFCIFWNLRGAVNQFLDWLLKKKERLPLDIRGRHHLQISPLLRLDNDPSGVASFWSILGSHFLVACSGRPATLAWISSNVWNLRPLSFIFSFGNKKKSLGARSRGCGTTVMLLSVKTRRVRRAAWAGALSWWSSHELFRHWSGRFLLTFSRRPFKTST